MSQEQSRGANLTFSSLFGYHIQHERSQPLNATTTSSQNLLNTPMQFNILLRKFDIFHDRSPHMDGIFVKLRSFHTNILLDLQGLIMAHPSVYLSMIMTHVISQMSKSLQIENSFNGFLCCSLSTNKSLIDACHLLIPWNFSAKLIN